MVKNPKKSKKIPKKRGRKPKKVNLPKPPPKKRGRKPRSKVGGANANAAANVNAAKANANVSGVNTMAPKTGANVGGAAKKRGRKPKSKVGGANANKGSQTDRSVQAAQTEESGGLQPTGQQCRSFWLFRSGRNQWRFFVVGGDPSGKSVRPQPEPLRAGRSGSAYLAG